MKCHYEVLDVSRDADASEIKTAYRKSALKWHPDKNLDNTEFAKEQFQLVQQAYEVLSDPQERAWYDKHREQILRGSNSEFQDSSLDVFQYFTTTCFKGYGDDERGFYTVYRHVFDEIIKEDLEFFDDKEEFCELPRFGDSKSDYDDIVGPFYSYWTSYSTKKSYVWLDPYNINETRDRKILKIIEKENKKIRQKAKKERNDEIRNLVAFVRKRDKRVQEHTKMMEAKVLENRQKQEEISKQKRLERKKELNESGAQAEWAKFDNVKSELEEIEKNLTQEFGEETSNSEEEDEDITDLYCIACNKIFKTPKAMENHESSKKHKENVALLKEMMLDEEEEGVIEAQGGSPNEEEDEDIADLYCVACNKIFETPKAMDNHESSKKHKENVTLLKDEEEEEEEVSEAKNSIPSEEDDDSETSTTKKQKKKNKKAKNILTVNHDEEEANDFTMDKTQKSDDDFDFESTKKQKKKNSKTKQTNKSKSITTEEKVEEIGNVPETTTAKNRRKINKKDKDATTIEDIDTSHCCVTCKSNFQSKNKLFDHLKKTGHGVYLPSKASKNKKKDKEK